MIGTACVKLLNTEQFRQADIVIPVHVCATVLTCRNDVHCYRAFIGSTLAVIHCEEKGVSSWLGSVVGSVGVGCANECYLTFLGLLSDGVSESIFVSIGGNESASCHFSCYGSQIGACGYRRVLVRQLEGDINGMGFTFSHCGEGVRSDARRLDDIIHRERVNFIIGIRCHCINHCLINCISLFAGGICAVHCHGSVCTHCSCNRGESN